MTCGDGGWWNGLSLIWNKRTLSPRSSCRVGPIREAGSRSAIRSSSTACCSVHLIVHMLEYPLGCHHAPSRSPVVLPLSLSSNPLSLEHSVSYGATHNANQFVQHLCVLFYIYRSAGCSRGGRWKLGVAMYCDAIWSSSTSATSRNFIGVARGAQAGSSA